MVKALFNRYKIPCIITAGKSGVFYTDMQGKIHCLNSLAEQVVDSVGAGDAFHGGFIFGIAKGMNIHQAVLAGSICAAENCKKAGAREGMPRKKVFFNNFAVFSRQLSDKYQMSVDYLRKY
ncbi:MAG TPA: hypothetical protein DC049_01170 [Spirochaetia bacterium]|nr:hypothetical protein [Spirochaetia bacterium]